MADKIVNFEDMKKFQNSKDVIIIDVREPKEIEASGKIERSINIPLGQLEDALKRLNTEEFKKKYNAAKPNTDAAIVFMCQMGSRAEKALKIALDNGFTKARYYKGSWDEWKAKMKEQVNDVRGRAREQVGQLASNFK